MRNSMGNTQDDVINNNNKYGGFFEYIRLFVFFKTAKI